MMREVLGTSTAPLQRVRPPCSDENKNGANVITGLKNKCTEIANYCFLIKLRRNEYRHQRQWRNVVRERGEIRAVIIKEKSEKREKVILRVRAIRVVLPHGPPAFQINFNFTTINKPPALWESITPESRGRLSPCGNSRSVHRIRTLSDLDSVRMLMFHQRPFQDFKDLQFSHLHYPCRDNKDVNFMCINFVRHDTNSAGTSNYSNFEWSRNVQVLYFALRHVNAHAGSPIAIFLYELLMTDRLRLEITSSFNYTPSLLHKAQDPANHIPISTFYEPDLPSVKVKNVTCPRLASCTC